MMTKQTCKERGKELNTQEVHPGQVKLIRTFTRERQDVTQHDT